MRNKQHQILIRAITYTLIAFSLVLTPSIASGSTPQDETKTETKAEPTAAEIAEMERQIEDYNKQKQAYLDEADTYANYIFLLFLSPIPLGFIAFFLLPSKPKEMKE